MKHKNERPHRFKIFGLILLVFVLYACGTASVTPGTTVLPPTPAPSESPASETPTEMPTPIPPPTATPTQPAPTEIPAGAIQTRAVDGMPVVFVPAGQFKLGAELNSLKVAVERCQKFTAECEPSWFEDQEPVHLVTLDSYWIDQFEVTNAQYRACVEAGACQPPLVSTDEYGSEEYGPPEFDNHPVTGVPWQMAQDYCTWAGGRLPTEAEWEAAARGPEGRRFPWGDPFNDLWANLADQSLANPNATGEDGFQGTAPVGSFQEGASWCGAMDMTGNIFEWVADWYGPYSHDDQVNPTGPSTGELKVIRGGNFNQDLSLSMASYRDVFEPQKGLNSIGFRCVTPPDP